MRGRGFYIGRDLSKISPSRDGFFIGRCRGVEAGDPVISRIEVSPSVITLDANDLEQFTAIAYDQFDQPINSGVSFQWSTSDPSVAVVDSGGLVEAYAGGSVNIVAAANGVTGSATITVEGEVADVVASYDQILLLNPDIFIPLQLASYRGQQVLYKDSTFTDPVLDVGDPVGGVWDLAQDDEGAVAPSSSDRPIWQGVGGGTSFDGVSDTLRVEFLQNIESKDLSIATYSEVSDDQPGNHQVHLWAYTHTRLSAIYNVTTGQFYVRSNGAGQDQVLMTLPSSGSQQGVFSVIYGAPGSDSVARFNGIDRSGSTPDLGDYSHIWINSIGMGYYSKALTKWLCIWHDHRLTESEMLTLEALNDD